MVTKAKKIAISKINVINIDFWDQDKEDNIGEVAETTITEVFPEYFTTERSKLKVHGFLKKKRLEKRVVYRQQFEVLIHKYFYILTQKFIK